jgi:hypothetical protein
VTTQAGDTELGGHDGGLSADVDAIQRIDTVPRILEGICRRRSALCPQVVAEDCGDLFARGCGSIAAATGNPLDFHNVAALSDWAKALLLLNKSQKGIKSKISLAGQFGM